MRERSSNRRVGLVTIVLILSVAVGPALGAIASPSATQLGSGPVSQQGVDTDSVRLIVSVEENGSATWTVQYWTRLDDENTTAAFESLQRDIEATPSNFSDRFASRMRSTVRASENATGREMAATGFGVTAETRTPPDYGVIVYTFRWDGFAAVDGDTVRVGDAIEGLFLDDRTRLVIEWPTATADDEPTVHTGYTPRFHVAPRTPETEGSLESLRAAYERHPSVAGTAWVERRPGFRHAPTTVLAVDCAHVDRVRPLAAQSRRLADVRLDGGANESDRPRPARRRQPRRLPSRPRERAEAPRRRLVGSPCSRPPPDTHGDSGAPYGRFNPD